MYTALILNATSTTEAVESTALPLESINHVHGSDCFPASVLSVRDRVANDVLQKDLQHATCFFIDQSAYALDSTSASQTADGRLRDTLNVITEHLAMALSAAFSQTLTALAPP